MKKELESKEGLLLEKLYRIAALEQFPLIKSVLDEKEVDFL